MGESQNLPAPEPEQIQAKQKSHPEGWLKCLKPLPPTWILTKA